MSTIALILMLTLVAGFAAGCGGGNQPSQSGGNQPAQGGNQPAQGGNQPADDGKVYSLSLSQHDPASSNKTKYHVDWANTVNEASGGRLDITVFSDGVLAGGTGQLDALRTNVCDIAWVFPVYWPGQFPISEVVTLPLGITTVPQATNILWDLYETSPEMQAEVAEFIPLQIHTNPVSIIGTANKPVYKVSDLVGMKMRVAGGAPTDSVSAWGGTPMQLPPGDIFQAVERGTVDGYVFEFSGIVSFSLQEVTNYFTEVPVYAGPYYLMMNRGSFEALPADLQDIIMSYSNRETSLDMAYVFEGDCRRGKNAAIDIGCTIITADEAETDEFLAIAHEKVLSEWINTYSSAFNAQGFVDQVSELARKYFITSDQLNAELDRLGL